MDHHTQFTLQTLLRTL